MDFKHAYKALKTQSFRIEDYSIVPIRYEDRFKIMEWRNEQMYHLRQTSLLTKENQENYFKNVVANLFDQEQPDQILFSYLKNNECIGYGGLVHINWIDQNAEISFIMKTELEQNEFKKHWGIYLDLIEEVAFKELNLHKLYTYAFDIRPHLYVVLEEKKFRKEAVLEDHCFFNEEFINIVIHSKIQRSIKLRKIESKDEEITFLWANDEETRKNSFNSKPIIYEEHSKWFQSKIDTINSHYFICEVDAIPAGLVRFDYNKEYKAFIIGITIDKRFRDKKLSSLFLKRSCEKFVKIYKSKIIAFIKVDNIASKKSFERAGFIFQGKEKINENEALKYEYKHE